MDLNEQKRIQKHFEGMYQQGQKPWRHHPREKSLDDFFKKLESEFKKAKVLDIGCGDGWISLEAASRGHEVWGIDSAETAIEEAIISAQKTGFAHKVHFEVGNALKLPYDDNFFDAIIDRGLFHHILPENREIYLENITRVLAKKSLVYLSVFSLGNPEGIGERFTKKKIEVIFGTNFKIVYFNEDPLPLRAPAHLMHAVFERRV